MSKRGRGERDCANFSKKLEESDYYINFDSHGVPVGPTTTSFMNWFGLTIIQRLPLHLNTSELPKNWFEELWLETKVLYFIFVIY